MTIILGGDSSKKTFSLKEPDARYMFFFHNSKELFLGPPRCRVRQNDDSTGDPRTKLCFFCCFLLFLNMFFLCCWCLSSFLFYLFIYCLLCIFMYFILFIIIIVFVLFTILARIIIHIHHAYMLI